MKTATLELMVDNMKETIEFYTQILGFEISTEVSESNPFFAIVKNGDIEIMFYSRKEFSNEIPKFKDMVIGGTFALYIGVEDIQKVYNSIKDKVTIIQQLHKTDYGSLEFSIEDINGYILMFHQDLQN